MGRDETVDAARGVSIVAPTFREAENIPILAERVQSAMAVAGVEWELIRFGLPVRLLSFAAVGGTGLFIDSTVYLGLQWAGSGHLFARFLFFWPAVTWNWRLNRTMTFHDRPPAPPVAQWTRFAVASMIGLITNVGSYAALTGSSPADTQSPPWLSDCSSPSVSFPPTRRASSGTMSSSPKNR